MATQNLTGLDALLKNVYRGPWVELLNQETYIVDQLEKTNANELGTFNGRQLIFPVHTSRNRGRGGTTDGGALATAGTQGSLDGIVTMKYFDQGIELSDQVIKQSKSDEGSFVRALTFEMDLAATDLRKDIGRVAYGTGDGLLASVLGTPSGTSITVDSGQYIAVGDTVDILVKSTGATTNGVVGTTVTAVSYTGTAGSSTQANATLTISAGSAGALSTSYGVYLAGDRSNESDGLRNIISTGRTLHQINSSTNPIWDSNSLDLANSNPSEDKFMQLAQTIRQISGKTIDSFITTLGVQRRLANTYASQKRWNDNHVTDIDGGYEAIMVSAGGKAVPVVADVDCPNGQAFGINKSSFAWAQAQAPDWLEAPDGKGSVLHLKDGSSAGTKVLVWQAWMIWYVTLVNIAPNRNGVLLNISDDKPVPRR